MSRTESSKGVTSSLTDNKFTSRRTVRSSQFDAKFITVIHNHIQQQGRLCDATTEVFRPAISDSHWAMS